MSFLGFFGYFYYIIIIIIIYFAQQYKTAVTNINSQRAGQ